MNEEKYEIISIAAADLQLNQELDGIIPKAWVDIPSLGKVLFKEAADERESIAESRTDWSEKVVSEINQLVDLPTARYELAIATEDNEAVLGIVSVDLSQSEDEERFPIEELLGQFLNKYDYDYDYQVNNVIKALSDNNIGLPPNSKVPEGINDAADMFVGILMMDAAVGNSDRHDRNLDIVRQTNGQVYLSPVFDQGYSLGAAEDNDLRSWIDPYHYNLHHNFSSFSINGENISGIEAFTQGAGLRPEAAKIWLEELRIIDTEQIEQIFQRLPERTVSPEAQKFALDLFVYNQKQLLDLNQEISEYNEQQERVEKVAPILIDYLKLNQKQKVESRKSIIEFDSDSKSISYEDKQDNNEYLKAKYTKGKWYNIDSNISQDKESYFIEIAAPKIAIEQNQIDISSLQKSRERSL